MTFWKALIIFTCGFVTLFFGLFGVHKGFEDHDGSVGLTGLIIALIGLFTMLIISGK